MLTLRTTSKFRKDYKLAKKRGLDLQLLEQVIDWLLQEKVLDPKYKDHPLTGNYVGFRECHIQSDWLLIYTVNKNELVLTAARTGTHSDLFSESSEARSTWGLASCAAKPAQVCLSPCASLRV